MFKLSWGKVILWIFIVLLTIGFGSVAGALYGYLRDLPHLEELEDYRPDVVTTVYAGDNQVLAEFFQEKRVVLPFEKIPPRFIQALLAVEDTSFYSHWGINFKGILRALWMDIKAGRIVQGGSTLTQQLAKVLFLTPEKTIKRKLKEALLALQIEKKYTKNEILAMYCNQIYLGSGSYGLEAAARNYFGENVAELDLPQLALLAGLPKSPEGYSPFNRPKRAVKQRNIVLRRMLKEGIIERPEFEAAQAAPLELRERKGTRRIAPHFVEMVRRYLEKKYGVNMLYRKGLNIYTTLNADLQQAAEQAVAEGLAELKKRQGLTNGKFPEAALLALQPETGNILSLVGGADFEQSKFNRALQAKRQPGSAFKPVIYGAALDVGYTAATVFVDEVVVVEDNIREEEWRPQNFDKKFLGPITLRKALEDSRNVVSVKLLERLGIKNAINFAHRVGIESHLHPYLSLALGTSEVSLLELTAVYGVFANQGVRVEPNYIRYITDANGKLLEETIPAKQQAVSAQIAYLTTELLKGVVQHGTGWRARALNRPVAAKTGTTDKYKDAWFIGYIPQITAGVWVGFDRRDGLGKMETGSRAAAPIWVKFMRKATEKYPPEKFPVPENIVFVDIDAESGLLSTPDCGQVIKEAFQQGSEPIRYCDKHEAEPEVVPAEVDSESFLGLF